jgi:hypothetical protein
VDGLSAIPVVRQILLASLLLPWSHMCLGDESVGGAPLARGPSFMLYIRQTLGAPHGVGPVFGLRRGRRELLELQIGQLSGLQINLGHRLTWNGHRLELHLSGDEPGVVLRFPARAVSPANAMRSQPSQSFLSSERAQDFPSPSASQIPVDVPSHLRIFHEHGAPKTQVTTHPQAHLARVE